MLSAIRPRGGRELVATCYLVGIKTGLAARHRPAAGTSLARARRLTRWLRGCIRTSVRCDDKFTLDGTLISESASGGLSTFGSIELAVVRATVHDNPGDNPGVGIGVSGGGALTLELLALLALEHLRRCR